VVFVTDSQIPSFGNELSLSWMLVGERRAKRVQAHFGGDVARRHVEFDFLAKNTGKVMQGVLEGPPLILGNPMGSVLETEAAPPLWTTPTHAEGLKHFISDSPSSGVSHRIQHSTDSPLAISRIGESRITKRSLIE
jgi:hypothetical protein